MARKKISISSNAPITLFFAFACICVFIIQYFNGSTTASNFFAVGGNSLSDTPFDRLSIVSYISIIVHIFSHSTWNTLTLNIACILLLGPQIEKAYGKALYSLMIVLSAFVCGVLCTVFVSTQISGAESTVLLFIVLSILSQAKEKTIPSTLVCVLIIYVLFIFFDTNVSISEKIVTLVGSLCASIFGFIDFFEQTKPIPRKKKNPPAQF